MEHLACNTNFNYNRINSSIAQYVSTPVKPFLEKSWQTLIVEGKFFDIFS